MSKILTHRIHGKRHHQQVVAGSLIGKYFMWVIGQHVLQRYHSLFNGMPLSRLIKKILSRQSSSNGQHRCVTPLYRIPM